MVWNDPRIYQLSFELIWSEPNRQVRLALLKYHRAELAVILGHGVDDCLFKRLIVSTVIRDDSLLAINLCQAARQRPDQVAKLHLMLETGLRVQVREGTSQRIVCSP